MNRRARLDSSKKKKNSATSGTTFASCPKQLEVRNPVQVYVVQYYYGARCPRLVEMDDFRRSGCVPSTFLSECSEETLLPWVAAPRFTYGPLPTARRPYLGSGILYSVRSSRELLRGFGTSVQNMALTEANLFRSMSAASEGQAPVGHICLWSVTRYPRAVSTAFFVSKSFHQSQNFIELWQNPHPVPNARGPRA